MSIAPSRLTSPSKVQAVAVLIASSVFAIGATAALASVANAGGWCCVHSWALAHGTGLVVLLLFGLVGFHVVRTAGARFGLLPQSPQFGVLPHVAYISGALGTFLFTQHFMWLGLLAGVAAVVRHVRGHRVAPFGIALGGLVVCVLAAAYWAYIELMFLSMRNDG